jgi:YD repeat-containing protein
MKISLRSLFLSASLLSPSALLALPVDLSAPAGGIGPTSEQGAALQWLEMTDINFGGGFTLPLRMSFLTTRKEEGQDFGEGYWRTPLHDSRLLTQSPDQKTLMLPCGKIMALEPKPNTPGIWQTPDGEWVSRPKGPFTVVSREDGWELEYNAKGYLIRLQNDARRNVLWTRDATGRVLSLAELTNGKSQPPAYTVSRDPKSGRVTTLSVATLHGVKNWQFNYHPNQQLKTINFPDTTTVVCDYPMRQDGQPQIAITGRDTITTLLTWDKSSHHLLSDGVWSYTITPQAGTNPVMTRVGPGGETEVHHEDKANHRTLFTAADGTVTTRSKITTGAAKGKLARVERQPAGAEKGVIVYQAEYDERGLLVAEIDALGRKTTHSYTLHGTSIHSGIKLRRSTNPLGHVTSAEFDAKGNAIATTDALGHTTRNEYDEQNRMIKTIGPDGTVTKAVSYTTEGKIASRTDAAGHVTQFGYDKEGNLITTKDALGNLTTDRLDARGIKVSSTDPLGRVWKFEHDKGGRIVRKIGPDGVEIERRAYDAQGRVTAVTDAAGNSSQTTYDLFGRVTARTDALGRVTAYAYEVKRGASGCTACNASAMPTLITMPSGRTVERVYDADRRLIEERTGAFAPSVAMGKPSPTGLASTRYAYDLVGNMTSIIDPLERVTSFEYDGANNRIKTTQPDKTTRTASFDAAGHLVAETDEMGATTKRMYDAYGNLTSVTDAVGGTLRILFDDPGSAAMRRSTGTLSPAGVRTDVQHDPLGRKIAEIKGAPNRESALAAARAGSPDSKAAIAVTLHEFDAVGNETRAISPAGKVTTHQYDLRNRRVVTAEPLGRVWKFVHADNSGPSGPAPCCGADPGANSKAVETLLPDGTKETRFLDAAGQLIKTTDPKGDSIAYTYDPDGRLETLTDAKGNVTRWTYDALGKLASKTYPDKSMELYENDLAGQLVRRTRPDGTGATYTYNPRRKLTNIQWDQDKAEPSEFTYNAAGNMTVSVRPSPVGLS